MDLTALNGLWQWRLVARTAWFVCLSMTPLLLNPDCKSAQRLTAMVCFTSLTEEEKDKATSLGIKPYSWEEFLHMRHSGCHRCAGRPCFNWDKDPLFLNINIKEDVEAVQISGGPAGLEAELQQLKDLRRVNQELLVQTEELLQKQAREESQFRSQFGTKWTRPQSSTLTKNLQDRLNRFAGNLKQAAESDARIERSVREHSALMSILDARPINCCPICMTYLVLGVVRICLSH